MGIRLCKLTTNNTHTWSNSNRIEKQLDHIFVSEGLAASEFMTDIIDLHKKIETDHHTVVTSFNAIHILASQTQAKRKLRNKANHAEKILDLKHCSEEVWEYFKEMLDQNFIDPFEGDGTNDVNHAYGKIIDQVIEATRNTLH